MDAPAASLCLWVALLDDWAERTADCWAVLSPEERARAGRFRRADDRRRFILAHGLLRNVLAACCNAAPGSLRFQTGRRGKPALAGPPGDAGLRFSLSAADGALLLAVAWECEVGADIERVRPDFPFAAVAARWFPAEDAATLRARPAGAQAQTFFARWTRLEALVKATGAGLGQPLSPETLRELCSAGDVRVVWAEEAATGRRQRWTVSDVAAPPGYAAAVAVAGDALPLHRRRLVP